MVSQNHKKLDSLFKLFLFLQKSNQIVFVDVKLTHSYLLSKQLSKFFIIAEYTHEAIRETTNRGQYIPVRPSLGSTHFVTLNVCLYVRVYWL